MLAPMRCTVRVTDRADEVLAAAGRFLGSKPVEHNLILTLLHQRAAAPVPGRYWTVAADGEIVGVVIQSPLTFPATLTPMPSDAVVAAVDAVVDQGVELPGVGGEASSVARFAGRWTERRHMSAVPTHGQRLYELRSVALPDLSGGRLRVGDVAERDLLVEWMVRFLEDIGEDPVHAAYVVDAGLATGQLWVWDVDRPVSMAANTDTIAGVNRVRAVYTPPEHRCRGYASVCVGALSAQLLERGERPILYTDLANATSNSVYRRLGYTAVSEILRYRFD